MTNSSHFGAIIASDETVGELEESSEKYKRKKIVYYGAGSLTNSR